MTLFFRNADLGNTDSIAETDSERMFIYYFYSMGGNAIESLASHVNGANKDYGRDCLFFRNQRLSHIHDITDFPTRCVRAFCLKRRPFSPPLGHFR